MSARKGGLSIVACPNCGRVYDRRDDAPDPHQCPPWLCYPCVRGDHDEHKTNAWEPDIRCECEQCTSREGPD